MLAITSFIVHYLGREASASPVRDRRFTSKWGCQCGYRMLADFSGLIPLEAGFWPTSGLLNTHLRSAIILPEVLSP